LFVTGFTAIACGPVACPVATAGNVAVFVAPSMTAIGPRASCVMT
jgi:hypothetical protein